MTKRKPKKQANKRVVSLTIDCELAWPYSLAITRWNGQDPKPRVYYTNGRRLRMLKRAIRSDTKAGLVSVEIYAGRDKSVFEFIRD